MHIDIDILIAWGAVAKKYKKGDFIFYEGDSCRYYYQLRQGRVKMCCYNEEGRVFTQGLFQGEESFGEPPLFLKVKYPACAVAETNCVVWQLCRDTLFKLFNEYPELHMHFIEGFAQRIYDKSFINKNLANPNPENRIIGFLKKYKEEQNIRTPKTQLPFTRQQIADSVGLRVETVIRTIKKMEENHLLEIQNHKVYF